MALAWQSSFLSSAMTAWLAWISCLAAASSSLKTPGTKGGEGEKDKIRFSGVVGEAQASSR